MGPSCGTWPTPGLPQHFAAQRDALLPNLCQAICCCGINAKKSWDRATQLKHIMNFESDLAHIIKQQFDKHNIFYEDNLDVRNLAARYLEMLNRRITPFPRSVHFSEEIHDSLGKLRQQADLEKREAAADAWGVVFLIRHLLIEGKNVNCFLSKRIDSATGKRSVDPLLWDFGMHHFHLSKKVDQDGFAERSDYLLFAIVAQEDVYFVDVKLHCDPLVWFRQDLLKIAHSNWPELIQANVLRGVKGTVLTDEEKQNLRRKNINSVAQIGDNVIAPMGGGLTKAGTSTLCQFLAMKFLKEVRECQTYLETQPAEIKAALQDKGRNIDGDMEFKLVLMESLGWSDEMVRSLKGSLHNTGFGIVEVTTRTFVDLSFVEQ